MPRPRPQASKRCPRCKIEKTKDEFYQSLKYDGGLSPYCKVCHGEMSRDYKQKHPAQMRALARKSYAKHQESRQQRSRDYSNRLKAERPARYRAKKFFDAARSDVAPDVTMDFLEDLFLTITHCQCCGKQLTLAIEDQSTRIFRTNPNSPSIDRVNNRKGYTRKNIGVICWGCNYRKTDLTLEDLKMFENYIRRYGDV